MSDAWLPLDPARAAAQLEAIRELLGSPPRRVLDAGCGDGRLLAPLAADGHDMIGMDLDARALGACAAFTDARLVEGDYRDGLPEDDLDAVICCGHTFMLHATRAEGAAVLATFAAALREGGLVVLDDFPRDLRAEVESGNWQTGISEDGSWQMVWEDPLLVLRRGDAIDPDMECIGPDDRPMRLWRLEELAEAASDAGLSAPAYQGGAPVMVMRALPACTTPPATGGC